MSPLLVDDMSWPAEKCFPFDFNTITFTRVSSSAARHAWSNSINTFWLCALAASGRFSVITPTWPSTSYST